MQFSEQDIRSLSNRLRRAEGQIRGIDQMIHGSKSVNDIISQIKAVKSALAGAEIKLLDMYLEEYEHSQKDSLIKTIRQLRP